MSSKVVLGVFDRMLREATSDNPPEWVLKMRAARAELERTGKRVAVSSHEDNCGAHCRNVGPSTLLEDMLHHDCCHICNQAAVEFDEVGLLQRLQGAG